MDPFCVLGIEAGQGFLAVSPHPDDVELGCGGTVAQLRRLGHPVDLAVFTDGRLGTRNPAQAPAALAAARAVEQEHAAAALGVSLRMLGLPDGGPHDHYHLRDLAVSLIRQVRPHWVFVCDPWLPYEAHSDHRAIGLAVAEAALLSDLPHYAPGTGERHAVEGILFYFPAQASSFIPLSEADSAARRRAIACHESQFQPGDAYLHRLDAQLRSDGQRVNASEAERLHVLRRHELHIPTA